MFKHLLPHGFGIATVGSSINFTLCHMVAKTEVFIASLMFCWAYYATARLIVPILLHIMHNSLTVLAVTANAAITDELKAAESEWSVTDYLLSLEWGRKLLLPYMTLDLCSKVAMDWWCRKITRKSNMIMTKCKDKYYIALHKIFDKYATSTGKLKANDFIRIHLLLPPGSLIDTSWNLMNTILWRVSLVQRWHFPSGEMDYKTFEKLFGISIPQAPDTFVEDLFTYHGIDKDFWKDT